MSPLMWPLIKRLALLVAGLLPLLFAPAAAAQTLMDGIKAYIDGDATTAARVLRPFAERGDASAQVYLAILLFDGIGTRQDRAAAVRFARSSAEQGNHLGQYILGRAYAEGKGTPLDYVLAYMWLNLAASQEDAAPGIAGPAARRDQLAAKMTAAQIAEGQQLARDWRPKKKTGD